MADKEKEKEKKPREPANKNDGYCHHGRHTLVRGVGHNGQPIMYCTKCLYWRPL
jgi:hypothetical protein